MLYIYRFSFIKYDTVSIIDCDLIGDLMVNKERAEGGMNQRDRLGIWCLNFNPLVLTLSLIPKTAHFLEQFPLIIVNPQSERSNEAYANKGNPISKFIMQIGSPF